MVYLIVAGVAVMLTVGWIGWSGLLGLLIVMGLFGLFSVPLQRESPVIVFPWGAMVAAIIHCVVLTVCFAGFGASTEVFWIVYIAALAASTLIFRKKTKELEEDAKEPLKAGACRRRFFSFCDVLPAHDECVLGWDEQVRVCRNDTFRLCVCCERYLSLLRRK